MTKKTTNIFIIVFAVLCAAAFITLSVLDLGFAFFDHPSNSSIPVYIGYSFCGLAIIYYIFASNKISKLFRIFDIILNVLLYAVFCYCIYKVILPDYRDPIDATSLDTLNIYGSLLFWLCISVFVMTIYHYLSLYNLFDKTSKRKVLTPKATKIFMIVLAVTVILYYASLHIIKTQLNSIYECNWVVDNKWAVFFFSNLIRTLLPSLVVVPIAFLAIFGSTKLNLQYKIFDGLLHILLFVCACFVIRDTILWNDNLSIMTPSVVGSIWNDIFIYTYIWVLEFISIFFMVIHFIRLYCLEKEEKEQNVE